jgi:hypothetical protein
MTTLELKQLYQKSSKGFDDTASRLLCGSPAERDTGARSDTPQRDQTSPSGLAGTTHILHGDMVSRFAGAGDSTPGWSKFAFELRICLEFRFWIGGSKARAKLCSSMSPQQIAYYGRGLDLHTRGPIMAVSLS